MSESRKKTIGAIGLTLGLVALMLIGILTVLHGVGTDDSLYHELQISAGVLPSAGISEEDLITLDAALAHYLAGSPEELLLPMESEPGAYSVLALEVDGELRPAFHERELAHLEDCADLFGLLRKVRRRLIPWAVLLIVGGAWLLGDRKKARKCAWLSPLILLIPLGAYILWAVSDFDGAFTFFHRVLFSNDLWLLDPSTDLLIRICPESMFMAMGRIVVLRGLLYIACVLAVATGFTLIWPEQKQNEGDKWNGNRAMRRAYAQSPKIFDVGGKH